MKPPLPFRLQLGVPLLKRTERLERVLSDGAWHSTNELVHVVGHTFAVAKYMLVHKKHIKIERQRHPDKPRQFQYRLMRGTLAAHRATPSHKERWGKQRRTQQKKG